MLYVLMYEDAYDEGNYPIAVVNEKGKRKIQEMEFERKSNYLRSYMDYSKKQLIQYSDSIKGYENVPDVQETLNRYKKNYEQRGKDYKEHLDSKDKYFNENGTGMLNFIRMVLHPFEVSGGEIGEEILKDGYTTEIGENEHFVF